MSITIDDIIRRAGGAPKIARESKTSARPIGRWAVYKWPLSGIENVHWDLLMRLDPSLTIADLYEANRAVRDGKPPHPKRRAEARAAA